MKVRKYADVVKRILGALGKSERLTTSHKITSPPYPIYCLHYNAMDADAASIYVSAGIHGDEPAGVECAIRLLELLADEQHNGITFPFDQYNWIISPCDNPYGYERNIRENAAGLDLNRMFENPNRSIETIFIAESLLQIEKHNNTKVQLALDLHEDRDSNGFYLWERRTSTTLPIGNEVVHQVKHVCAINQQPEIENHRNENGVITLLDSVTTKGWTRGRFLAEQIQTRCLILETPTTLKLETRINAHMLAIQTAIKQAINLRNSRFD